ncbi:PREDICTED: uncharacterized protein LOC108569415 [Nicrophorus vespilloides]|uniref:Uncharacterized protein LOC108569415 n=1 Tax=Nicrophorus vespilloides TaxID=110193 RepID=A0ABM1NHZ7_NICVS|nr:PREDICTED: uncharacterized protein LOC108569415 [Nicrophorus vespilloides]
MKTILAVLLLSATAPIRTEKLVFSAEYKNIIALTRIECAVVNPMDPKLLFKLDDIKDLPSREILKCHSLCMIKKLNLLNDDNIMELDKLMQLFSSPSLLIKVPASYAKCQLNLKSIQTCNDGYDVQQCLLYNV